MSLVIAEPHAWLAVGGQRLSKDLGVDLADVDLGLGDRVRVAGRLQREVVARCQAVGEQPQRLPESSRSVRPAG